MRRYQQTKVVNSPKDKRIVVVGPGCARPSLFALKSSIHVQLQMEKADELYLNNSTDLNQEVDSEVAFHSFQFLGLEKRANRDSTVIAHCSSLFHHLWS